MPRPDALKQKISQSGTLITPLKGHIWCARSLPGSRTQERGAHRIEPEHMSNTAKPHPGGHAVGKINDLAILKLALHPLPKTANSSQHLGLCRKPFCIPLPILTVQSSEPDAKCRSTSNAPAPQPINFRVNLRPAQNETWETLATPAEQYDASAAARQQPSHSSSKCRAANLWITRRPASLRASP